MILIFVSRLSPLRRLGRAKWCSKKRFKTSWLAHSYLKSAQKKREKWLDNTCANYQQVYSWKTCAAWVSFVTVSFRDAKSNFRVCAPCVCIYIHVSCNYIRVNNLRLGLSTCVPVYERSTSGAHQVRDRLVNSSLKHSGSKKRHQ